MDPRTEYALGTSAAEVQRLRRQNEAIGDQSQQLLEQLGIAPGWRVADVGCGPRGLLESLSHLVGPDGQVVGLDVNEVMIDQARAFVVERGLANVELHRADAVASGLPPASFDLVHERLVLINVPRPAEIIAAMVAMTRRGGLVVLEDIDGVSWACDPPHPAWDRLYGAFIEIFRRRGADPHIGRRLPGLLRQAGLVDVRSHAHVGFHLVDHPWRHLLLQFVELVRQPAVAAGLLRGDEVDPLKAELRAHLDDPRTTLLAPVLAQAWARRPASD